MSIVPAGLGLPAVIPPNPAKPDLVSALLAEVERDRQLKKQRAEEAKAKAADAASRGEKEPTSPASSGDEGSDSDRSESPGQPDPKTCTVTGPGFAGGASGVPVNLFVTCKDEDGKRITEGGDDVQVRVVSKENPSLYINVEVSDKENGMYVATYTAPAKGMYMITVMVNGIELEGSPFPVFFGPPGEAGAAAAAAAAAADRGG